MSGPDQFSVPKRAENVVVDCDPWMFSEKQFGKSCIKRCITGTIRLKITLATACTDR
jgi:hypothetical protein